MDFFSLSKIFWSLASPTNLLFLVPLFIFAFSLLHAKVLARVLAVIYVLVAGSLWVYPWGDALITPLENRFSQPQNLPQAIDGILILGGGEDYQASLVQGKLALGEGGERFTCALQLAQQDPTIAVIFTGGSGSLGIQGEDHPQKPATMVGMFFEELGIEKSRLIIEDQSRNTYENFINTKPLLPKTDGTYLLVTSAFHMPRSVGIARKLGVNVVPYPCDFRQLGPSAYPDFSLFDHLKTLEPALREWIGLSVYYWTGKTSDWFPAPETPTP